MYPDHTRLTFERQDRILTITMNNPPLNAADRALHDELSRVFDEVAGDASCDVIILTGTGTAFSAGGDFTGMWQGLQDSASQARSVEHAPHLLRSALALDKPVIARVNGHAMGLGATLALLCDVVIAADTARIGDPHVKVGLAAGDGGALLWPHLVGYARARHHLLTGEALGAVEAERIGLIHKAVPLAELDAYVQAYAQRLAQGATQAIRATKRAINMALCAQAAVAADAHIGLELMTMSTQDHREAVAALLEKRTPLFKGR